MDPLILHPKYGSHIPILMKIMSATNGDVLECGVGLYSTPILHWLCYPDKRHLVSYEHDPGYYRMFREYGIDYDYHKLILVDDWDKADIEKPWDVALIDHSPQKRRMIEAQRLAPYAKFVLVHDSDWRNERHYNYNEIYPLFKYRYDYTETPIWTTVLSNFVNPEIYL